MAVLPADGWVQARAPSVLRDVRAGRRSTSGDAMSIAAEAGDDLLGPAGSSCAEDRPYPWRPEAHDEPAGPIPGIDVIEQPDLCPFPAHPRQLHQRRQLLVLLQHTEQEGRDHGIEVVVGEPCFLHSLLHIHTYLGNFLFIINEIKERRIVS